MADGFARIDAAWWLEHAPRIVDQPWPPHLRRTDLDAHRFGPVERPAIRELSARWGVSKSTAGETVKAYDSANRTPTGHQPDTNRTNGTGETGQSSNLPNGNRTPTGHEPDRRLHDADEHGVSEAPKSREKRVKSKTIASSYRARTPRQIAVQSWRQVMDWVLKAPSNPRRVTDCPVGPLGPAWRHGRRWAEATHDLDRKRAGERYVAEVSGMIERGEWTPPEVSDE